MKFESKALDAISLIERMSPPHIIATSLIEVVSFTSKTPVTWAKVQRHPLGFLALVVRNKQDRRSLRIHLWDRTFNWTQSEELEIHDHVFDFFSCVLSGQIRNEIYSTQPAPEGYSVFKTKYSEGASHLVKQQGFVSLLCDRESTHHAGSFYEMRSNVLHRTVLESPQGLTALSVKYPSSRDEGAVVIGTNAQTDLDFERSPRDELERLEWLDQIRSELERIVAQDVVLPATKF